MARPFLDQATLKRLLHYDPQTGVFTWLHRSDVTKAWNTRYSGKVAGYDWTPPPGNVTYRNIRIFDWPFLGHRLAWLYMTGSWPTAEVDHKDTNGLNNKWENLRSASKVQNGANRGANCNNKTGFKGVSRNKRTGRYRATIQAGGKWRWLGSFDTAEQAHAAYCAAAALSAGEFVRTA